MKKWIILATLLSLAILFSLFTDPVGSQTKVRANQLNLGDVFAFTGNNTHAGTETLATMNGVQFVDGVTNTTALQAMNKLPSTGGTVYFPCSTTSYTWPVAPTNGFSNVSFISLCGQVDSGMPSVQGISPINVTKQVVLSSSSTITLSNVQNFRVSGITIDFGQNGAGLVLNSSSYNQFDHLSLKQCGNTATSCLQIKTTGIGSASNSVENEFHHLQMTCNQAANQNCLAGIQLIGNGPLVSGSFTTLNKFWDTSISGSIAGCIDAEINSDTNFFWRVLCTNVATVSNSYVLGFNLTTPASDQDADGGIYTGVAFGGSYTSIIRAGQSSGNIISMSVPGGGVPSFTNLGGTPTWVMQVIGLGTQPVNFVQGGTITASAITGGGPATGATIGDITAARATNNGTYYLGSDGSAFINRNAGATILVNGSTTSTQPGLSGTLPSGIYLAAGTTQTGAPHIVSDTGTLTSGTPSTVTITLAGNAIFSSASSYNCSVTNKTTQANPLKITYTDGSHFVVTGPNTVTDAFSFVCAGN